MNLKSLRVLLREWGEWRESGPYSDSTVVAQLEKGNNVVDARDEYGSRPPIGVECPQYLQDIDIAIKVLGGTSDLRFAINAVRLFYTCGVEQGCYVLNISKARLYRRREHGERALLGYFAVK